MKGLNIKRSIASVLVFSLVLGGCGFPSGKSAGGSSDKKTNTNQQKLKAIKDEHSNDGKNIVGISMPSRSLERWNRDGLFLKKSFEDEGYEVMLEFSDDLIDSQIDNIDEMIKNKADVLLIAPIDGSALVEVLKRAAAANIKVISYDRLMMKSRDVDYYVSFDNYRVGQLQGKYIENALKLKSLKSDVRNIEIISGDPADNNARYFYQGAYDVLKPYLENDILEIPSEQETYYETAISSWSTELANERFTSILNSYYVNGVELDAVCCANDSTALGVIGAIDQNYKGRNSVVVTGQDADEKNLPYIQHGGQSMTVYKALSNEAIAAVALTRALLESKKPSEEWISSQKFGFELRYDTKQYDNGEKIVPSLLLEPVVITRDNIEEELVKPGYYVKDENGNLKAAN